MNIIVCLDKKNNSAFNNRRQSRDKNVIFDIITTIKNSIYITEYSLPLFQDYLDKVKVIENFNDIKDDGYVFLEKTDLKGLKIDNLIVYRWDKIYPSDTIAIIPSNLSLKSTTILQGNSHDEILKEIYN